MSKYLTITIFAILLILLALPQVVSAAVLPFNFGQDSLVPCGRCHEWECVKKNQDGQCVQERCIKPSSGLTSSDSATQRCNLCHFFELVQNVINLFLSLIILIAPVILMFGGFMILSSAGMPERVSYGKRVLTYAIIALLLTFGAWTIVNTVLVTVAGNIEVGGQKVGKIGGFPWPWNKVNCYAEPVPNGGNGGNGAEGKYCVCEAPVYDLDPEQWPNHASIIGTNVKVTKLNSADTCKQECVSENAGKYCPSALNSEKANLYCVTESSARGKNTCAVKLSRDPQCHISKGECWSDALQCAATVTPGAPQFNSSYAKRCFLDGQSLCSYIEWSNGATYCSKKVSGPCNSSKPYTLYRFAEEGSKEELDALTCSNRYYGNTGYVCRLNCQYDRCQEEEENTCDELSQAGACFGGNFTCQKGVADQTKSACNELKTLLTCMAGKSMPAAAREISSISDNSPLPRMGSLGKCFDTNYWNSVGQCSGGIDSCTGTCCAHSKYSLHYGGKPAGEGGSVDCRQCSWAVDFASEQHYQGIKNVAEVCAEELWSGGREKVDVKHEGNHVHVELEGIAKYYGCK